MTKRSITDYLAGGEGAEAFSMTQLRSLVIALTVLSIGCNRAAPTQQQSTSSIATDKPVSVRDIVATEETILAITPRLKKLQRDFENLSLRNVSSEALFAANIHVDEEQWREFFSKVSYVESSKIAIERADFTRPYTDLTTPTKIHVFARTKNQKWCSLHADVNIQWQNQTPQDANSWKIVRWDTKSLESEQRDRKMFVEVLDQVIPNQRTLEQLRESRHYFYATNFFYPKRRAKLPTQNLQDNRFFPVSTATHPGLAVVDINNDGWDDLYVMQRWGKNMLLRNRGNGTFEEAAEEYGLDVDGRSNAGIFADFDNDGDPDLMLARSFERSQYFVNEDGRFVDRSDYIACPLPYEATSLTAADYNNDGLLDVYFCTYHQDDISSRIDADLSHPDHRIHQYLSPEHSEELKKRFRKETRSYVNQIGPPNILLTNRGGGRFELKPEDAQLALWRNSFQAAWCDYDGDGDVDVYIANDFAADHLMRNDRDDGFKDVTIASGIDRLGFAMGVSWGDCDGDGRQDLYVSNMFSKAGRRITAMASSEDPRIAQLADGNYLYRNVVEGDRVKFDLVSDVEYGQRVARAGWSWGGQFFDADNDSDLDLFVPNGYYSVPKQFETTVDL